MAKETLIGFAGFSLIVGPFAYGLAMTLAPAAAVEAAPEVAPIERPAEPEYISFGFPTTTTVPRFDKSVTISLSFMVDRGSRGAELIYDQIYEQDQRLKSTISGAVVQASEIVDDPSEIRGAIPGLIRHEVNLQLANDEDPHPIREVLITSFAMQ